MKYRVALKISVNLLCISAVEGKVEHLVYTVVWQYISFISFSALTVLLWSSYR